MRRSALAWIGHPGTVVAVVVLLVNDHFLKAAWPGVVTGKLSDVAGLVVAPALVNLVVREARVALLVVGAGFAVVKSTEGGAEVASQAWSLVWGPSRVLADPTDLLTLPALWLAWWIWTHPDPRAERLARVAVVIPVAVVAVAATSPAMPFRPYSAFAVDVADGVITVETRGGPSYPGDPNISYFSSDGGRSWVWRMAPRVVSQQEDCVAGRPGLCYRIVPGRLKVEESRGGRWVTAWEVPPGEQDRLVRAYPADLPEDTEVVESLAVAAGEVPGGYVVVVANGADGIALRDTAGVWRRLGWGNDGFDEAKTVPLTVRGDYGKAVPAAALLAAMSAVLIVLGAGVRTVGFAVAALILWAGEAVFCTLLTMYIPSGGLLPGSDSRLGAWALRLLTALVLVAVGLLFTLLNGTKARIGARAWLIALASGPAVYFAVMAPFYAWSRGVLDHFTTATGLAIALGVITAAGGVAAMFLRPGLKGH
ncbi:hypothetical protein [Acrocarpospora catenulata]|uniref:hypothetical protein n=1 Tax=Acrocarpospora catenulata TaxID=2836182 RepID=UPI001BDB0639|nr:hypothetical protein [Acrocarpospora catenulata]